MTKRAYERLIDKDIEWLREQCPGNLDKDNIEAVLKAPDRVVTIRRNVPPEDVGAYQNIVERELEGLLKRHGLWGTDVPRCIRQLGGSIHELSTDNGFVGLVYCRHKNHDWRIGLADIIVVENKEKQHNVNNG